MTDDFIFISKRRFYMEIMFVDIKTDTGMLLYDTIAPSRYAPYKTRGFLVCKNDHHYIIRHFRFRNKYLQEITQRIAKAHDKALLLGYTDIQNVHNNLETLTRINRLPKGIMLEGRICNECKKPMRVSTTMIKNIECQCFTCACGNEIISDEEFKRVEKLLSDSNN